MDGWMYRLLDGPHKHNALGPSELEPPEEIFVFRVGGTNGAWGMIPTEMELDLSQYADVTRYRRTKMSNLTDEQVAESSFIVRGAEYEMVAPS